MNNEFVLKKIGNENRVCFKIIMKKSRKGSELIEGITFRCNDGIWATSNSKKDEQSDKRDKEILQMLLDGFKQKDIANIVGFSTSTVSNKKKMFLEKGIITQEGKSLVLTERGEDYLGQDS